MVHCFSNSLTFAITLSNLLHMMRFICHCLLNLPDTTCHVQLYKISDIWLEVTIKHSSIRYINKEIIICLAQLAKGNVFICHNLSSVRPSAVVPRKTFTSKYSPLNSLNQITPHLASSLKQIQQVDMSLHSDALFLLRGNQYLLLILNTVFLEEKQQI